MTSPPDVPGAAAARLLSPSESRVSCRRRPARDSRCSCPKFSTILSMAARPGAPRPARDIGGPALFPAASSARCLRLRARSSARTSSRSSLRLVFCCSARRSSRHLFPHVTWMLAVDGSGRCQARHMQQRRRVVLLLVVTPRRLPSPGPSPTSRLHIGRGTFTAPGWISRPPRSGSVGGRRQRGIRVCLRKDRIEPN